MKSLLHYSLIIQPHHSIKAKIPHVLCKTSKSIIMVQPAWVLFDCLEFEARNRKLLQNISKYLPIYVVSYSRRLEFFSTHLGELPWILHLSFHFVCFFFWYLVNILYEISRLPDIFNIGLFKHSLHSPFLHDSFFCKQVRILRYLFRSTCSR